MIRVIEKFDISCDICGKYAGICADTEESASLDAIKHGWVSIGGKHFCRDCKIPTAKRKDGRVYPVLRMLADGDFVVFPLRSWQSARSAASKIKKDFGCTFTVHREGDNIFVTRIK